MFFLRVSKWLNKWKLFLELKFEPVLQPRQRLQVESPKVKSEGAIVSRAGVSGLRMRLFSRPVPTSALRNTCFLYLKPHHKMRG